MIFRNWVLQNFPFLEDDFDALTDYELFCKMMEYVKKFAKDNEEFKKQLESYQNYFDNLDVQEEINKKLDEMASDGTLENIISQYIELATTYVYDNVSALKSATNLINGSYARTSGFYTYKDGGGSFYKIRTITNEDVVDEMSIISLADESLVAELVANDTINVKQLGAKTDINNLTILSYAINNFNNIVIDEVYPIQNTLSLTGLSNKTIYGKGGITINHSYNKNLIEMTNCSYITFEGIEISNDTKRVASDAPSEVYLMYNDGCNFINFYNVRVKNGYNKGVDFINSGNLTFINCSFKNCYYDMLIFLTECHDILVDNCLFDTTECSYTNAYLIATGSGQYSSEVAYLIKNLTNYNVKSKYLNKSTMGRY